ncbi:MAG TPA: hypothetical protein VG674_16105 [Amycolatopsis sp.]|nr:hypothetical protein [Amycolatopsis sp.]
MTGKHRAVPVEDYVTQQQRALAVAVLTEGAAGDGGRSFRLAEHLAAEGGLPRSDILAATTLLLACAALGAGDVGAAQGFARRLRGLDPDSVELVLHLLRLEVGLEQGWLARAHYDELMAYAWRENRFDLVLRAGDIQARDVDHEAAGWWRELERNLCPLLA